MLKIFMTGLVVWPAVPLLGTVLWSLWFRWAPIIRWELFHTVGPGPKAFGRGVIAGRFVELSTLGFVLGLVTILGMFLLRRHG